MAAEKEDLRKEIAQKEPAWQGCGLAPGLNIWRIEHFQVVPVKPEDYGKFYLGDSYIILSTVKQENGDKLIHTIFFLLGPETSVDEQGTAAYKTIELHDYFNGEPHEFREEMTNETSAFKELFINIEYLDGGIDSGFKHVVPEGHHYVKLYQVRRRHHKTIVHRVPLSRHVIHDDDCYILDAEDKIYVLHGESASPFAKEAAAVHATNLEREHQRGTITFDINEEFWAYLQDDDAESGGDADNYSNADDTQWRVQVNTHIEEGNAPSAAPMPVSTNLPFSEVLVQVHSDVKPILTPFDGDTVTIHYAGTLSASGEQFSRSTGGDPPFVFEIGGANRIHPWVKGWDEGIVKIPLGATATMEVPAALGYGETGFRGVIPPGADLRYEVELLKINGKTLQQFTGHRKTIDRFADPKGPSQASSAKGNGKENDEKLAEAESAGVEQRIDPEDGIARTLKELKSFYKGLYSEEECDQYWETCTSLGHPEEPQPMLEEKKQKEKLGTPPVKIEMQGAKSGEASPRSPRDPKKGNPPKRVVLSTAFDLPEEVIVDQKRKTAFKAIAKDDAVALAGAFEGVPMREWSKWQNKSGQGLVAACRERGACRSYAMLISPLGLHQDPASLKTGTEPSARAFRAVAQDDIASLAVVIDSTANDVWLSWRNKAGKDLIVMSRERNSKGCLALLQKARASGPTRKLVSNSAASAATAAKPAIILNDEDVECVCAKKIHKQKTKKSLSVPSQPAALRKQTSGLSCFEDLTSVDDSDDEEHMEDLSIVTSQEEIKSSKDATRNTAGEVLLTVTQARPAAEEAPKEKLAKEQFQQKEADETKVDAKKEQEEARRKAAEDTRKRMKERNARELVETERKLKEKAELEKKLAMRKSRNAAAEEEAEMMGAVHSERHTKEREEDSRKMQEAQARKAADAEKRRQAEDEQKKAQSEGEARKAADAEKKKADEEVKRRQAEDEQKKPPSQADPDLRVGTRVRIVEAPGTEHTGKAGRINHRFSDKWGVQLDDGDKGIFTDAQLAHEAEDSGTQSKKAPSEEEARQQQEATERRKKQIEEEKARQRAAEEAINKVPPTMLEGDLKKKGKGGLFRKAWDARYVIVKEGQFAWYGSKSEVGKTEPKGVLDFMGTICEALPDPSSSTSFVIRPKSGNWEKQKFKGSEDGREFIFDASGSQNFKTWLDAVNAHCEFGARMKKLEGVFSASA